MYPNVIHKSILGVNGGVAVDGAGCAMHKGQPEFAATTPSYQIFVA